MRRYISRIIIALFVALLPVITVFADVPDNPSDDQIQQVAQNCRQTQVNLRNLQKRDTVLRINRGRIYDMILRQTGAFVSRLDVNKVDAPDIKASDSAIRAEVQHFREDYDRYANSLDVAITMNCSEKPREFYDQLTKTISERKTVGREVATIKQQLATYIGQIGALRDDRYKG